jgi:large conductance mechanosensitive channel
MNKKVKKLTDDFKNFALKDAAFGTAIGIMLGAALKDVITSLIDNLLMPPIAYITSGIDFSDLFLTIGDTDLTFKYGAFINSFIIFIITALVLFILTNVIVKSIKEKVVKDKKIEKKTTKECPYCKSEINKSATRCPHCTSKIS